MAAARKNKVMGKPWPTVFSVVRSDSPYRERPEKGDICRPPADGHRVDLRAPSAMEAEPNGRAGGLARKAGAELQN